MKTTEIVQNFYHSLEQRDFNAAEGYLTYDFILSGPTPVPLSKKDYLNFMQALLSGFPDWAFNVHDIQTMDNEATYFLHITGTNTRDIPPLFSGMPPIKATGKQIHLAEEEVIATLRGDRIQELKSEKTPGGGVEGILEQLGIQVPLGLETPISSPVTTE